MRPNLVIITIDCMRADFVSEAETPVISSLGQSGRVYASAYANGCGTPDSFPAMFASRMSYPFAHDDSLDVDAEYALKPSDVTIAEALRAAGYDTAAFIGGNPYLGRRYGYHRGFDTFVDNQPGSLVDQLTGGRLRGALRSMAHHLPWSPYPDAEKVIDQVTDWLCYRSLSGDRDRPFMLWAHFMDAHFPTLPPGRRGIRERQAAWAPIKGEGAKHHDTLVELYRAALSYTDAQVGQLLGLLPPESVVVVTSDHGQLFGEHGSYHHNGVWEELLHVPLIIAGPSVAPGVEHDMVQMLDLAPHLLELLDVDPPREWSGEALRAPRGPVYAVSNNPGNHSYTETFFDSEAKTIRRPDGVWELQRAAETPEMVLS